MTPLSLLLSCLLAALPFTAAAARSQTVTSPGPVPANDTRLNDDLSARLAAVQHRLAAPRVR